MNVESDMELAMSSLRMRHEQEASIINNNNSNGSAPPASITTSSTPHTNRILADWRKGQRPMSEYLTLSKAVGFLDWDCKLHALASSNKTHLVLYKSYSPPAGSDEFGVFQAMKIHMLAVFVDDLSPQCSTSHGSMAHKNRS